MNDGSVLIQLKIGTNGARLPTVGCIRSNRLGKTVFNDRSGSGCPRDRKGSRLSSSKDVHDGMPRVATVSLRGELSDSDADRVLELARQALAPADVSTLVIDMAEVTFIDTMVIGALVQLRHTAQPADVEVRLRGLRPGIRRVLTIAGVDTLFTYQDSPEGS